jgi:hypothetical protein
VTGAMCTAEKLASALDTVSDHFATAVLTDWGQFVDCTLEAVKDMAAPGRDHLEAEIVFVTADFAFCHVY